MRPLFLKYDKYLECRLCPHLCKIREGKTGICGVRKNSGERIDLLTYGVISGYSLDPVEKNLCITFFRGIKSYLSDHMAVICVVTFARTGIFPRKPWISLWQIPVQIRSWRMH